eukprot:10060934-Lingulodinium_polyedra.AAC.1
MYTIDVVGVGADIGDGNGAGDGDVVGVVAGVGDGADVGDGNGMVMVATMAIWMAMAIVSVMRC